MYIQLGIFAMVVGVVNPIQYSSIEQYRYFGASVSTERLKQLMGDYGIQVTGDADKDIQALYTAMYGVAQKDVLYGMSPSTSSVGQTNQTDQQQSQPQQTTNVPWAALMNLVGLYPTGNLSDDLDAFNNKIQQMSASATSASQKATIAQLQAEAQIVFVQPDQGPQQQGQQKSAQQGPPTASGADITAMLNRLFMVG